jgi:hypothetical protein
MNIDDQIKFIQEKMGMFNLTFHTEEYMMGYHLSNRTDEGLGTGKKYVFTHKHSLQCVIDKAYNYFVNGGVQTDVKMKKLMSDLKAGIDKLEFRCLKVLDIEDNGDEIRINYSEDGLSDVDYEKMTQLEEIKYQEKKIDDNDYDIGLLLDLIDSVSDDRGLVDLVWCGFRQEEKE